MQNYPLREKRFFLTKIYPRKIQYDTQFLEFLDAGVTIRVIKNLKNRRAHENRSFLNLTLRRHAIAKLKKDFDSTL